MVLFNNAEDVVTSIFPLAWNHSLWSIGCATSDGGEPERRICNLFGVRNTLRAKTSPEPYATTLLRDLRFEGSLAIRPTRTPSQIAYFAMNHVEPINILDRLSINI
jgi:hypothetical protein